MAEHKEANPGSYLLVACRVLLQPSNFNWSTALPLHIMGLNLNISLEDSFPGRLLTSCDAQDVCVESCSLSWNLFPNASMT